MVQLPAKHHGLLHNRKIQTLTLLGFEVLETLLLELGLALMRDPLNVLLFTFTIVADLHELLGTLPLTIDTIQELLLVPLEDVEASLERLQHA